MRAVTRLLKTPEIPPREWFTERPDDFVMGQTLRVYTTGPNEGRAAGLIQPPPHDSAYMSGRGTRRHRNHGRRPPDSRLYPDQMTFFNRGPIEVLDADGSVGVINGGSLPLFGGHSQEAVGASTIEEAGQFLHREERWAFRADELGLHGVAYPVNDPGYEGSVLFLGAALPKMTVREAAVVNSTSMSAEVWSDPTYNNQLVFAGATGVKHTAWPYHTVPEALAAEADDDGVECEGPECHIFFFAAGVTGDVDDPEDRPDPDPVSADPDPEIPMPETDVPADAPTPCGGACQSCRCGGTVETTTPADIRIDGTEPEPEVVAAEVDESDLTAIETTVNGIDERLTRFEETLTTVALHVFGPGEVGAANMVEGFANRIEAMEEVLERLAEQVGRDSDSGMADAEGSPVG